ncbi:MAG: NAD(P)H-hydrate dehydratase [Verrucomicrobiales bacterium]|jgi:NAD(P)H-hydrate epimerase|nr:NAD(P)H-hydrate dehydratase [Verrucomicrobiales bacterium]
MKVVPPATVQNWEQDTLAAGITVSALMRQAVDGCFHFITEKFPVPGAALFLCGKGNNGNDGLWLAGRLADSGWDVEVLLTESPTTRKLVDSPAIRAALANAQVWPACRSYHLDDREPALVFDCLLGVGAAGEPAGVTREVLEWWQTQRRPWHTTVSIDTPSGLNADTGHAAACAFQADFTLAIGAVKQGCLGGDGSKISGRLAPIPLTIYQDGADHFADFFDLPMSRELAQALPAVTHKYQRGDLAVFAGSPGFLGAAVLTTRAALRAGAGVVRLFCHPDCYRELSLATPEALTQPWDGQNVPTQALTADAWAVGPGFGTDQAAERKFSLLLRTATRPLLLDADALLLLNTQSQLIPTRKNPIILTPHEGEFQRLRGTVITNRQHDSVTWVNKYPNTILVLKGANTLITEYNHLPSYNSSGNPGLATAGSGDVLSGIISALLAQGMTAFDAARLGTYWHGLAADTALTEQTEQTLLASDVIHQLSAAWKKIRPLN